MAVGTALAIAGLASGGLSLFGASKSANAAKSAAQLQSDAYNKQGDTLTQATNEEVQGLKDAIPVQTANVNQAATSANDLLTNAYTDYVKGMSPYTEAGTTALSDLSDLSKTGGKLDEDFTQQFDSSKVTMDPAFALRLKEGQEAIERSAAAKGGFTGGTLKELTQYAQEQTSKEYASAYDRAQQEYSNALKVYQANMTNRQARANTLAGLVNTGQTAATSVGDAGLKSSTQQGENLTGAAKTNADITLTGLTNAGNMKLSGLSDAAKYYTGAADATASGKVAAANAWSSGLSSIGKTMVGVAGYSDEQKKKTKTASVDAP